MRHSRITGVVLAALAVCVFAAPASARRTVLVDEQGRPIHGPLVKFARQAKVPLPPGRIQVRRTFCPIGAAFLGCVYTARPRVLYLRPSIQGTRRVFLHELGHVFDLTVLNARERRGFKRILGIRRSGWFLGGLPPAEWFAEGYAACAVSLRRRLFTSMPYGYAPTARRYARVCRLILAAAKPGGRPPKPPKNAPPVVEVQPPPPQETQPSDGCTLVDELLSGCEPVPAPAPAPRPPLPVSAAFDGDPDA